ncbi:uncharacterized protein BX663DRAFT_520681 [Cokeromyces recurvatus]|uniref:uncharacterized protein n=1 Tax=Cokeromyces recurvatus TaxID=90255 RepID=UPI00221F3C50|nr:uncharacterized protein BX663DRAFT_520681 [Cokeromyces recurvatus]KAI7899603.1 hypothetical protein BX663DRAFT_520681 [Cokeromyces recurvatus]
MHKKIALFIKFYVNYWQENIIFSYICFQMPMLFLSACLSPPFFLLLLLVSWIYSIKLFFFLFSF